MTPGDRPMLTLPWGCFVFGYFSWGKPEGPRRPSEASLSFLLMIGRAWACKPRGAPESKSSHKIHPTHL